MPQQVNTDEISLMRFEREALGKPADLFGISDYFGFPALPFAGFSRLGEAFGGIGLANMRLVHATFGLLIVLFGYGFFRIFWTRPYALGAATLLGFSHALIGISRLAQWDNLSLFVELLALIVLFQAIKARSLTLGYLAGAAIALSWYVYLPSRITLVIVLAFLVLFAILSKDKGVRRFTAYLGIAALAGFLMTLAPLITATNRYSERASDYWKYQLLLFPEGRERQQEWMSTETIGEAVRINIVNGLTTFNNLEHDQGFIYENRGHGFIDPLSGVLLWVGYALVALKLIRTKEVRLGDLLALIGFTIVLLTNSFIVTQSPNYTRLLVVLPYVTYLVVVGLRRIAELEVWPEIRLPRGLSWLRGYEIFAAGIIIIGVWNGLIYADYVVAGFRDGNDVGATGRYVAERAADPDYDFYLFADDDYPYYRWGGPEQWREWMGTIAFAESRIQVFDSDDCDKLDDDPPLIAFMSEQAWDDQCSQLLLQQYPDLMLRVIVPQRNLLAIEVLE